MWPLAARNTPARFCGLHESTIVDEPASASSSEPATVAPNFDEKSSPRFAFGS